MIEELKKKFKEDIAKVSDKKSLDDLRLRYLGRNGELNKILRGFKEMSEEERVQVGRYVNEFKNEINELMHTADEKLKQAVKTFSKEWLDITAPGAKLPRGHLHPRTQLMRRAVYIFESLGFSVVEGPEIETDWYNFEALNFPKNHPVREMQDTFYIKNPAGGEDLVARTHTSPVQVRFMEKNNPPLRIIVPGRVYRREATDASHDYQFYQIEGLMVDKNISAANFKAIMEEFFRRLYKQKVAIRLRPSYFPFTEPSFEVDMGCVFCDQKGCKVCGQSGWLEIAGAGMVNQAVFENAGYVRNEWQGFAFGIGFERMVMMKYRINDIRLLNGGDIRFLRQF